MFFLTARQRKMLRKFYYPIHISHEKNTDEYVKNNRPPGHFIDIGKIMINFLYIHDLFKIYV